jgi:hypothetical protein
MLRVLTLALGLLTTLVAAPALATPGAVDSKGCHGRNGPMGYHCHSMSDFNTYRNGRHYVPFGRG